MQIFKPSASKLLHCKIHDRSLIEIWNRSGPKFDLCGTPDDDVNGKEDNECEKHF